MIYLYGLLAAVAAFLLVLSLPPVLWCFYLAIMNLVRVRDDKTGPGLNTESKHIGLLILIPGYISDALCNIVWATLIMLQWPRELTVTSRIQKLVDQSQDTYQRRLALRVAVKLLNPYSHEPHIRIPDQLNQPAPAGFFTPGVQ